MYFQKYKKIILGILLAAVVLGTGLIWVNFIYAQTVPAGPGQTGPTQGGISGDRLAPSGLTQPSQPLPQGGPVPGSVSTIAPVQPVTQTATDQTKSAGILLNLATSIASGILTLVAGLITFAINIGKEVIDLKFVQAGSRVMIAFANLGFVLAIIVIAFATIFRRETYAMKQTLWKLIVAALLVNFSLVIAGAFIDVSNILTDFFLPKDGDLPSALAEVLRPQALAKVTPDQSILEKIAGFFDIKYWFKYVISLFFVLIFTILIVFIFIALFVMLLIRVVALAILLILMPIVWLLWIFPSTISFWREWWNHFLRWTFFAPVMLFFINLIVNAGNELKEMNIVKNVGGEGAINMAFQSDKMLDPGFFSHVAQLMIIGGLLIGSLIVANRLSITGAKTTYDLSRRAGKGFGNWTVRLAPRAGAGLLRGFGLGRYISENLDNKIQQWQRQNPEQPLPRRLRLLQGISRTTQKATAYRAPGLMKSVWGEVKGGTGLFKKKKKAKEWVCQACGTVVKSAKIPKACPNPQKLSNHPSPEDTTWELESED